MNESNRVPLPSWYLGVWAVPPKPTLSEWADAKRYLSLESNPTGGRWHTDTVPYTREPMDIITDSEHEEIVFMWPTQAAKTEIENNTIGWIIDVDPGPILMIQETIDNGRSWSKDRFDPMVRDTPCLRGKISNARGIAAQEAILSNEILHKSFPGGHITIVGSNSGAGLSMRPIRYILADEVDAWAPSAGEEGDQLSLAKKRAAWFFNRKIVVISSPRLKATSRVEPMYDRSDQRAYHVPCPHCDHRQQLLWEHFRWEHGDPKTAHFICVQCQRRIEEKHKGGMLARGEWRAKYPGRKIAGFWIWAAYSPVVLWSTLVEEWLEAQGNTELLKVFINTRRCETWEEPSDAPDWEVLKSRAEPSPQWVVPHGVGFLVAAADVQIDRIEFSVWGFGRGEESWLIGHDVIWGNTDLDEPYLAFEQRAFTPLAQPTRQRMLTPLISALDSGAKTQQVYSFVRTRPHIYAIKGSNQQFAQVVASPTWQDIDYRGQKIKNGVQLWPIGVHRIKKLLYSRLKLMKPGPRFIHFPHDVPDSYYRGFAAEKLITHASGKEEWKQERSNEQLDCGVYAYAMAVLVGLSDPRTPWDRMLGPEEPAPVNVEPTLTTAPKPEPPPPAQPVQLMQTRQPQAGFQPRPRRRGGLMQQLLRG